MNGPHFSQPCQRCAATGGASAGCSFTRTMIQATNVADRMSPGVTPPTSSFEIEMPERLPRSTVSAEGGISMSTAPIAMIGPAAMVGW